MIKQKRVTKELSRAKKFIQRQRKVELASSRKRQQRLNSGSTDVAAPVQPTKRKGNVKGKEKKVNTNTYTTEQSIPDTNTLRLGMKSDSETHIQGLAFNSAVISIIKPRNQSDRTCFHNITTWLLTECASGKFNNEIFGRVLGYARDASPGRNPAAVFMALLKKELGYRPGK